LGLVGRSVGSGVGVDRTPQTALEARVAGVWSAVLGVDRVGAEDDFLVLGGDSLLATQVVARLAVEFGLDLSMALFFHASTVAAMAAVVGECLRVEAERHQVAAEDAR
jgi:acyl carrier protein